MPRLTGLQTARELHRRRPELHILMLSVHDNEQYFFEALKAGASGLRVEVGRQPRPDRSVQGHDARGALHLSRRRPWPSCGTTLTVRAAAR